MNLRPDPGEYMKTQGDRVSSYLASVFADNEEPAVLFEAMNYSLLSPGKRLRPVLCLAAARTFGVDEQTVLPAAAAIEMLHAYSLIHDDLPAMDDDDLRRGRPTNHKVYGEATAILAGDGLLTFAFEQLAKPLAVDPARQLRMLHVLARAGGPYGMVGGQQADILGERQAGSAQQLQFIHAHKTAALIEASVEIGALFAELGEDKLSALRTFGNQIGLAFQIKDDLLDVVGDPEKMGKSTGADEKLDKLTYPRLLGIEQTDHMLNAVWQSALKALDDAQIDAPLLVALADFVVRRNS